MLVASPADLRPLSTQGRRRPTPASSPLTAEQRSVSHKIRITWDKWLKCLVYRVSCRKTRTTQRSTVLKKKQNKQIRRFSFFKTATISFKVQILSKVPELTVDPVKS